MMSLCAAVRGFHLSALLALLAFAMGCHQSQCSGCPEAGIYLPGLNPKVQQTAMVHASQPSVSTVVIDCVWAPSTTSVQPVWNCTRDKGGVTTHGNSDATFFYTDSAASSAWTILITGPSGTTTVTRMPTEVPDDTPPVGCACDGYTVRLTGADLEAVGAVVGSSPSSSDAGVDAG